MNKCLNSALFYFKIKATYMKLYHSIYVTSFPWARKKKRENMSLERLKYGANIKAY